MSEILVIVPPEWTPVSADYMAGLIAYGINMFESLQGRVDLDLNDRLLAAGWFTDERRVLDVLVINNELYFKLG